MTAAIQIRKLNQLREENARFSWLGRSLGTLIVAGYMAEPDETKEQMRHASTMSMDEVEALMLKKSADNPADNPAPVENKPGSFERLMGAGIDRPRG